MAAESAVGDVTVKLKGCEQPFASITVTMCGPDGSPVTKPVVFVTTGAVLNW
jgi:hypothetical protein